MLNFQGDEIQQIPHIFPILRALIDRNRRAGNYVILCSASPHLLKQSSETLAGRIVYKELSPFNLTEVIKNFDLTVHWFRGGFPPALLASDEENFRTWIRNFVQTYKVF
ncbi:MAG TPA: ATP-binding protein [Caldithrix abyssi]|uniref:ATP-binding protein n=1 Tax=Caldithrix abyssi TaxID=187145 RepID=A0A7V4WW58_CALAY|nr:ATP-binding protein [Caldithrix abyssi]